MKLNCYHSEVGVCGKSISLQIEDDISRLFCHKNAMLYIRMIDNLHSFEERGAGFPAVVGKSTSIRVGRW